MVQTMAYVIAKQHGGRLKVEAKEARLPARAGSDGNDGVRQGEEQSWLLYCAEIKQFKWF